MIEIEKGPGLASKESRSGPILSIDKILLILKIKARDCEPLFASSNSEEPVPSKNRILAVAEVRTA